MTWRAFLARLSGGRDPLATALGRLERQVMEAVWTGGRASVRDVQARLPPTATSPAYTTVMTTLDRLYKKGLLERDRGGRAYVYRAAFTRQEVEAALASGLLRGLLDGGARPVLSQLVDVIGERDGALLDELEGLVREKRRRNRHR